MTNFKQIEEWYSGKSLETLRIFVIPTLMQAEEQGYWPKGVSRRVCAALNKQNVAKKFVEKHREVLESIKHRHDRGSQLAHAMQFGTYAWAPALIDLTVRLHSVVTERQAEAFARAIHWAHAFSPIAKLITLLDMARPKPVYVFKTLSPTVAQNLGKMMGLALDTIRMPEIKWERIEMEHRGKIITVLRGTILWPEGTKHGQSKFVRSGSHCEACGHAIKDVFNWVPLVAESSGGPPKSLWVGRDCAGKLFGCDVTGDAIFERE